MSDRSFYAVSYIPTSRYKWFEWGGSFHQGQDLLRQWEVRDEIYLQNARTTGVTKEN
jgi:hypothetical protein